MDAPLDSPACLARPGPVPFPLGPFLVAPDGGLHPRGRPALRFAWRGRGCDACVAPGLLTLSIMAGVVPYSADRSADRGAALAALRWLATALPDGWRLQVLPSHRLRLQSVRRLPEPASAAVLVTALVGFVLELDPYLDRLDSAGAA